MQVRLIWCRICTEDQDLSKQVLWTQKFGIEVGLHQGRVLSQLISGVVLILATRNGSCYIQTFGD